MFNLEGNNPKQGQKTMSQGVCHLAIVVQQSYTTQETAISPAAAKNTRMLFL